MIPEDILEESKQGIDSSISCKFDKIVYKDNVNDKTYSFRYFRPFKLDWRMLLNHPNGEPVVVTVSNAHGVTLISSVSLLPTMTYPQVNKLLKGRYIACMKIPKKAH